MFENINPVAFEKEIKANPNAIILDVRTPEEYEGGHLPGAQNINISGFDFEERVQALDKSQHYLVYCRSGARSFNACNVMTNLGFEKVTNMQGGILSWQGEVAVGAH